MRCVHLDFHTSPQIPEIGKKFDKEKFAKTFADASVELVTVFAKCHHGYTYYPSEIDPMHPGLDFDLFGEQLSALRSVGISFVRIMVNFHHNAVSSSNKCSLTHRFYKEPFTCPV